MSTSYWHSFLGRDRRRLPWYYYDTNVRAHCTYCGNQSRISLLCYQGSTRKKNDSFLIFSVETER